MVPLRDVKVIHSHSMFHRPLLDAPDTLPSFLFHVTFFYTKPTACDWNQETLRALLRQEDCCLAIRLNRFPLTTSVGIFDWLTHLSSRCPHALRLLCCPPRSRTSRTCTSHLQAGPGGACVVFQNDLSDGGVVAVRQGKPGHRTSARPSR